MISPRMYMILVLFAVGFYHFTITKLIYNQDDNPSKQLTALGFFGSRGGGFLGRLLFWRNDEDERNGILSWLKQPLINFWRNNIVQCSGCSCSTVWSTWIACSSSCRGGVRTRTQTCTSQTCATCPDNTMTEACSTDVSVIINCLIDIPSLIRGNICFILSCVRR